MHVRQVNPTYCRLAVGHFIRSFWQKYFGLFEKKASIWFEKWKRKRGTEVAIRDLSSGSTLFLANGTQTNFHNAVIESFRLYIICVYNCIDLYTYMIVCRIDMQ